MFYYKQNNILSYSESSKKYAFGFTLRLEVMTVSEINSSIQHGSGAGGCYTHFLPGPNWNYS